MTVILSKAVPKNDEILCNYGVSYGKNLRKEAKVYETSNAVVAATSNSFDSATSMAAATT